MKSIVLILVFTLAAAPLLAQKTYRRPAGFNQARNPSLAFLEKQWWLGFRAGANASGTVVQTAHHVIKPTHDEAGAVNKSYRHYAAAGFQATLEVAFTFRTISLSFQPTYRTNRFGYSNDYRWADGAGEDNALELHYEQTTRLAYIDWPLMVRYEIPSSGVRAYVQAGAYASLLADADNTVTISGIDRAAGSDNTFRQEPIEAGARNLFAKHHWGLVGGGGLFYNLGNVRLNLEILYKKGMSNIASPDNRYRNDRLTGVGDVPDDLYLNNVSVSAGCLFPLRFLASGFKSMAD